MSQARELRNVSAIICGLFFVVEVGAVWGCHYFIPRDGSYDYAMKNTFVISVSMLAALSAVYIFSLFIKEPAPADDKDTIIDEPNYGIDPETEKKYRASIDKRLHPTPDPFDISDMD